ncbi:hypothetical protein MWN33_02230 [Starkeya koreensis]|uniref:Peptidase M41 domain-containing protein n=1 Tax=Ancylobacter koreensis TaxID=266121 RepID=A0ABT0DI16_9HYPH|nr:hypothetical protein [Ancylobacter koreensis]MCK0206844.1 hypothetical protein [Ancylobacter koreensis]
MGELFAVVRCPAELCGEGTGFIEPVALPAGCETMARSTVQRIVEMPPPPRERARAVHEAAHAVTHHMAGERIEFVRVDAPAMVRITPGRISNATRLLSLMVGVAAEQRLVRMTYRTPDAALTPYVEAVKALAMGGCDKCRALTIIAAEIGVDAAAETYATRFRKEEDRAETFVREPVVWSSIVEIADELMKHGRIDGERAHEIAARHVPFGSIEIGNLK